MTNVPALGAWWIRRTIELAKTANELASDALEMLEEMLDVVEDDDDD